MLPLGERAAEMAMVLNDAFGYAPRGQRQRYAQNARRYRWGDLDQQLLDYAISRFPELVPLQRGNPVQEAQRHSWAYEMPSRKAYRHKIGSLGPKDIAPGNPWIRNLYLAARKNAAARGHTFDLTLEDIEAMVLASNGRCAVTGIALSNEKGELPHGKKMRRPWAPSIDRMDSTVGYTLGNCRIVCCAANYAMSQWGEDVLMEMAKSIARRRIGHPGPIPRRVAEGRNMELGAESP